MRNLLENHRNLSRVSFEDFGKGIYRITPPRTPLGINFEVPSRMPLEAPERISSGIPLLIPQEILAWFLSVVQAGIPPELHTQIPSRVFFFWIFLSENPSEYLPRKPLGNSPGILPRIHEEISQKYFLEFSLVIFLKVRTFF